MRPGIEDSAFIGCRKLSFHLLSKGEMQPSLLATCIDNLSHLAVYPKSGGQSDACDESVRHLPTNILRRLWGL
ncbi:hypothetical protein TNCV_188391 [Trichonephila clavipes]|nr:hypothetical protein TNCV_188391 [Trichonephila clavipes]